jgi:hypothetical protein
MIYPPGQGKSGNYLMKLWREYLEQYADQEGNVEKQIITGANFSVEILTALSRTLDGKKRYRNLIDQRTALFQEGTRQAGIFEHRLLNATFSIYNGLNTLAHQFSEGNPEAADMIKSIDEQAHLSIKSGTHADRSAAAMRAGFALLALMTIALDEQRAMTRAIRKLEQRFAGGERAAASDWDHLLNALYRSVEMMQLLALLTDPDLGDRITQIASRFQEEDQTKAIPMKMRNGFCRFFELGHLLITQVDAMV